jgi:hypothetical protein
MLEDLKKFWEENQLVCGVFLGSLSVGILARRYCIPVWKANNLLTQAFGEAAGNFTTPGGGYNVVQFVRVK